MGALACALFSHRFEVWVRTGDSVAAKHAHLGAWARCERCGLERDWLGTVGERPADTALVLDRRHGAMRPLGEVIAIARGELSAPRLGAKERAHPSDALSSDAARSSDPARASARPIRRDRAGRSSSRSVRSLEVAPPVRDPSDPEG